MARGFRWQAALILVALGCSSAWAVPEGSFRGFVSFTQPNGDLDQVVPVPGYGEVAATWEADSATGLAFLWEYRAGKTVGFETGLSFTKYDLNGKAFFGEFKLGDALAMTLPIAVNFHFGRKGPDFYVGPLIQFTLWSNLETDMGDVETDPDFGFGAQVGFDLPIGKSGFMFNVAARYMQLEVGDESMKVPIDPYLLDVGFGYRW